MLNLLPSSPFLIHHSQLLYLHSTSETLGATLITLKKEILIKRYYICTPSDTTISYYIVILLLATSFSLKSPSAGQNLQKKKLNNAGAYSIMMSIVWDPIYIHE